MMAVTSADQPRFPGDAGPDPSATGSPLGLRPLRSNDLHAVVRLQRRVYVARYHEPEAAYADRLADFGPGCLAMFDGSELVAYAIGYPWAARRSLPLDAGRLVVDAAAAATLYVHDVAVDPAHRGRGLATTLVLALATLAEVASLVTASLVAVQGAEGYWRRLGFHPTDVDLGPGYGDEATFMEADLTALRTACRRATTTGDSGTGDNGGNSSGVSPAG